MRRKLRRERQSDQVGDAGAAPAAATASRLPSRKVLAVGTLVGVAVVGAGILLALKGGPGKGAARPMEAPSGGAPKVAYLENRSCGECHAPQYQEWSGSHHDQAMQPATEQTVLGDFKDARFTHFGVTSRFFTRDGKFFVTTEGADGRPADFEIKYTFGVAPLQQYLIEFPGGRLQSLSIAWDTHKKRWFHLYPKEKFALDDPLRWTGRYQNWNLMCAECHTTDLRKGYDLKTDSYTTAWSEINVSCQACHGPGGDHVAWARAAREGKAAKRSSAPGASGLVVDFKANDSRYQVDACAVCHARRARLRAGERPGQPFLDTFRPALLQPTLYYPDGQQLDEVYEYGSFLQSKMYQRGVRCSDCHNPHSLKLKAQGNAVCLECHRAQPNPRFPTLPAKDYDAPGHHFHKAGSAGAQCVSCHMPARHYMVVDPRRDHSFRSPRPDLSVKLGTPNACTACHTGQSAQWAAGAVQRWYGPPRQQGPHYGEVIAAGRAGDRGAVPLLMALAGDGEQPAIVRATALDLLRGYGAAGATALVAATKDPDPQVRATAVGGLGPLAPRERLAPAAPLLKDPIRLVRIEAARVLASVPSDAFDPSQRRAYEAALVEFQDAQMAMADMPSSHLNLGVLYADQGRSEQAEQAYQTALRMDPYFLPARSNLAQLYNQMGRNADAERVLREGIARHPQSGELYYSLGLVLAEEKRLADAAVALGKAAALLPVRARVRYNHGLALQQLGRRAEAEAALRQANQLDPRDPQILYALAIFYVQQREWRRALPYAQKLAELAPGDYRARELLQQIQQASAAGQGPR